LVCVAFTSFFFSISSFPILSLFWHSHPVPPPLLSSLRWLFFTFRLGLWNFSFYCICFFFPGYVFVICLPFSVSFGLKYWKHVSALSDFVLICLLLFLLCFFSHMFVCGSFWALYENTDSSIVPPPVTHN